MALTELAVKSARPKDKPYKLFDERGLYLLVERSGGRLWRFKYSVAGREKLISLGNYPDVPLKRAREKRDEARRLVDWLLQPGGTAPSAHTPAQAWQSLRNRSSVGLQLGAGLTPGDVRIARLDAVVARAGPGGLLPWKIRLPAHGGAPAREAPIAPWAGKLLRSWIDARQAMQLPGPMLFPATSSGRPWGKVAQYMAAKAVLTAAGLQDTEGGSYRLRHTFALRQLKRGTAPERVAEWMGLSDTAALARYRRVLMAPPDLV